MKKAVVLLSVIAVAVIVGAGCSNGTKSNEKYTVPNPNNRPAPTNAAQARRSAEPGGGSSRN